MIEFLRSLLREPRVANPPQKSRWDVALVAILLAGGIVGAIFEPDVDWRPLAAVTTVLASGGYPGSYEKGKAISVPDELESEELIVFHAGTAASEEGLASSGGRVLAVTAVAETFAAAANASRAGAARIEFEGAFYRSDIGWRERARRLSVGGSRRSTTTSCKT